MVRSKILGISIVVLLILAFVIGCTSSVVPPEGETEQPAAKIVIKVTFPTEQAKVIPSETKYFEVALQRQGSTAWTTQGFYAQDGTEQTATFTVTPGTYRLDACAKAYARGNSYLPDRFLALGTTSVTVNAGETAQATISLYEIYYDFTETTAEATSTETISLSFKMKVPTAFVTEFTTGSMIWLYGTLRSALTDGYNVSFSASIVGTETINGVQYTTICYTSKNFQAPSVTETTTYDWCTDQAVATSKWKNYYHFSLWQTLTVVPGSGIIVVIQ